MQDESRDKKPGKAYFCPLNRRLKDNRTNVRLLQVWWISIFGLTFEHVRKVWLPKVRNSNQKEEVPLTFPFSQVAPDAETSVAIDSN